MKKVLAIVVFVLMAMNLSCGGGGSSSSLSSGTTNVTITLGNTRTADLNGKLFAEASSIPPEVTSIRFEISAPDMAAIERIVPVNGQLSLSESFTVPNGSNRHFVVDARDAAGHVIYTGDSFADMNGTEVTVPITMVAQDTVPPVFAGLSDITAIAPTSLTLVWSPAADNVTPQGNLQYLIYMATVRGGENFLSPSYTTTPGQTSFTVTGLNQNTAYYFVVRAKDERGNIDANSLEKSATTSRTVENPLVGTWAHLALDRSDSGIWRSLLETVTFRADGTGSEINRRLNTGGDIAIFPSVDFTYTMVKNTDGTMTIAMTYPATPGNRTDTHTLVLSDNNNMVLIDRTSDTLTKRIDAAIRMDTSKTYSNADFNVEAYGIGYGYDKDKIIWPGSYTAFSVIKYFDGEGNCPQDMMWNSDGNIVANWYDDTYTLNPDGSFTFNDTAYSGYIGVDAKLAILSRPTFAANWDFGLGMQKEDRTYATADLAGTWAITGFGDAGEGATFADIFGEMTCDTSGSCNAILKNQKDGGTVNESIQFHDISVEPDGSFGYFPNSIAPFYSSAIGNNGNTIFMNMSFGQLDTYDREILIGVRCSNCSNLAGQGIKIHSRKNIYFKKRNK
jgi:hypothetical protein